MDGYPETTEEFEEIERRIREAEDATQLDELRQSAEAVLVWLDGAVARGDANAVYHDPQGALQEAKQIATSLRFLVDATTRRGSMKLDPDAMPPEELAHLRADGYGHLIGKSQGEREAELDSPQPPLFTDVELDAYRRVRASIEAAASRPDDGDE